MKLEMTSTWIPVIQPGTYGTNLGSILEECSDDDMTKEMFNEQLSFEYGTILNEIFGEKWFIDTFGNVTVDTGKCVLKSPRYYNYENDSVEFEMEIADVNKLLLYYQNLKQQGKQHEFHRYIKEHFGSRSGFISFFPYEVHEFKQALFETEPVYEKKHCKHSMAVAMLLTYALEYDSMCDLENYQKDLEGHMEEYCSSYGLFDYDDLY